MVSHDYKNWSEYRAALAALDASSETYGGRYFAGVANVGAALEIADKGWPDGMARVRSIALPAVNATAQTTFADGGWGWDVTGADYDVGEYLSGAPECWLARVQPETKPVVTITANTVSSAGVPKECLEMRGAAVVALTLALQSAGYAVRVYAVTGAKEYNGGECAQRVCLTDDNGGPLDTDRVLFALAHPAAARTLSYGNLDKLTGQYIGSWAPHDPPESLWPRGDLYLPAVDLADANWQDAASVSKWVGETYAKLTAGDASAAKG